VSIDWTMAEPFYDLVVFAVDERHTKNKRSNFTKTPCPRVIKAVHNTVALIKTLELSSFVSHSSLELDLVVVVFVLYEQVHRASSDVVVLKLTEIENNFDLK